MKNLQFFYALILSWVIIVPLSCNNPENINLTDTKITDDAKYLNTKNYSPSRVLATTCGTILTGSFSGAGPSYTYANKYLDLSGWSVGSTVKIICDVYDVPNRFTIKDATTATIVSTGWVGVASYAGPWGASLNNPGQKTISFTKTNTTSNYYYLTVDTFKQTTADYWEAKIACFVTSGDPCETFGSCVQCTTPQLFNGNFNGAGPSYTYANNSLNLAYWANGATVSLLCDMYDVPNRFSIKDAGGSVIVSTGWVGVASYSGPWGSSLNNSGQKTLSFSKGASSYYLSVETFKQSGSTDYWEAKLNCPL